MSTAKHVAELIDALAKMRIENHELRLDERRWRNARDIWDGMNKQKGVKIGELEAENLALRIEREKLKEMVARYADIGACLDTGQNGKLMSLSQGGPLVADAIETPMCSTLCAKGEPCMIAPKCPNVLPAPNL